MPDGSSQAIDLDRLRATISDSLPPGYDVQFQVGSRQALSAMMRENPDLAARIGRLPDSDADEGRIDLGLVPRDSIRAVTYSALTIISIVLTVGMVWSHIRRRLSGQADVDDVDEND